MFMLRIKQPKRDSNFFHHRHNLDYTKGVSILKSLLAFQDTSRSTNYTSLLHFALDVPYTPWWYCCGRCHCDTTHFPRVCASDLSSSVSSCYCLLFKLTSQLFFFSLLQPTIHELGLYIRMPGVEPRRFQFLF